MTAHWGVPDPAAATGNEAEVRLAFADALRMLTNRINIFVSLPLRSLDQAHAATQLDAIGKTKDAGERAGNGGRMSDDPLRFHGGCSRKAWARRSWSRPSSAPASWPSASQAETRPSRFSATPFRPGAILVVLITILGPVSGAHFNPAVTLVFAARGAMPWSEVAPYIVVQCARRHCRHGASRI